MSGLNLKSTGKKLKGVLGKLSTKNKPEANVPSTKPTGTALSTTEQIEAESIFKSLDIKDTESIIAYGNKSQQEVAKFADDILAEVQTSDLDEIGDKVADMVVQAKSLDVGGLNNKGFLSKIPFLGKLVNKVQKLKTEFNSIAENIESTCVQLNTTKSSLVTRVVMLDNLYDKNVQQYRDLNVYIVAAEMKVQEFEDEIQPMMKAKVDETNDPLLAQELNDTSQAIERLSKKIHNLKLTAQATLQTSPQIRIIQANNQMLAERIQNTIDLTVPLWKKQFLMAIALDEQKKGAALNELVTDATNDFMKASADLMQDNSIVIAEQNERGVIDIETLDHVQEALIKTLEGTIAIQAKGKEQRALESQRLEELKNGVIQRLS